MAHKGHEREYKVNTMAHKRYERAFNGNKSKPDRYIRKTREIKRHFKESKKV